MTMYTLISFMHSNKVVVRVLPSWQEAKQEIKHQKKLRAFYRQATWFTHTGKYKQINFA